MLFRVQWRFRLSKSHLRGNTVHYYWKHNYGNGDKMFPSLYGFKELQEYMTNGDYADIEYNANIGRLSISRNGKELSYTKEDLTELLKDARGDLD
jgi:hypothetical protein